MADDAAERYRHSQGPWEPAQVTRFFVELYRSARSAEDFVIQEYIEPRVAGASVRARDFLLSEGVSGAAERMLRGGGFGDMVASYRGSLAWRVSRDAVHVSQAEALTEAHRSIPTEENALWEWIVDADGRVFHVDRKPLEAGFLQEVPHLAPPAHWLLGRSTKPREAELTLPDTSIRNLAMLREPAVVRIARGSPLAHLCHEAVRRGCTVVLAVQ
ncbi:MAG TPA: hypothetical protein VJT75_08870 [Thermoleophilaceae bacterium]|nr:hypothetical protein [Thermoleophilaceae bacterium]